MSADKELYNIIADEMSTKTMDPALWTQALAIAEGNPNKAQAAYIKLRFVELRRAAASQPAAQAAAASPKDSELAQLRTELARRLLAEGKSSFYQTLGVPPEASDASIASAIELLGTQERGLAPEFRYAKETLGNPQARENYDRTMLSNLRLGRTVTYSSASNYDRGSFDSSWWNTTKTSVIIGILAIAVVGYLGLGFFKEKGGQRIQEQTLGVQREAIQSTTNLEQVNSTRILDAAQDAREREAQMRDRQLDNQRLEQERRYDLEQQRMELQRQQMASQQQQRQEQAERSREQREKQYWACVNSQISVYQPSGSSAMARCASLRP